MNYLIFGLEIVLTILWLFLGPHQLLLKIAGIIIIILISQLAHHFLNAR